MKFQASALYSANSPTMLGNKSTKNNCPILPSLPSKDCYIRLGNNCCSSASGRLPISTRRHFWSGLALSTVVLSALFSGTMAQINGVLPETAAGTTTAIQEIKVHDTARETLLCQDSTEKFPVKNARMRGCEFIGRKFTTKRCKFPNARKYCQVTCGTCGCSDSLDGYTHTTGVFAGEKRSCEYVHQNPKRRCKDPAAQEKCPLACGGTCPVFPSTYPTPTPTTLAPTRELLGNVPNKTAVNEAMKHATYGYALPQSTDPSSYHALIPYQNNKGTLPVFNTTKITAYLADIFFVDTDNKTHMFTETSVKEFANSLSIVTKVDGGTKFLAGAVKASVAASFALDEQGKTEAYYTQYRSWIRFGQSEIPDYEDKTFIHGLMDQETLKEIQELESHPENADDLVSRLGVGYLSAVTLGSLFTMTSAVERQSWMTKQEVDTAVTASYNSAVTSLSASVEVDITGTKEGEHATSTFDLELYGGDPTSTGNIDTWKESTAQYPVIMNYQLTPVYKLVRTDSAVYPILKGAVDKAISNFEENIPGFTYKPIIKRVQSVPSAIDFLPGSESGDDIPVYVPKGVDPGFLPFGHGYNYPYTPNDSGMPVIKFDNILVKSTTDYITVWEDHGSGWDNSYAIYCPYIKDDPNNDFDPNDYYPLGYVVEKGHKHLVGASMEVAMLHKSLVNANIEFGDPFWKSTDHIGGTHSVDLYYSMWPGWPNEGGGRYIANLISSHINPVPGFDPHQNIMAVNYTTITYEG